MGSEGMGSEGMGREGMGKERMGWNFQMLLRDSWKCIVKHIVKTLIISEKKSKLFKIHLNPLCCHNFLSETPV